MHYRFGLLFSVTCWACCISSIAAHPSKNATSVGFSELYKEGVDAYLEERWQDCMDSFESAIHIYKLYLSAIADCRIKCLNEPYDSFIKKDIEDLKSFEKIVKRTLCFVKCKRIRYPNLEFDFPEDVEEIMNMENLSAYTYLHICYFQKNLIQKATSAVFTYLVSNPTDKEMKNNLDYYLTLPEVDPKEVTNFESPEYLPLYLHGINSYDNEDWDQTVLYMEDALHAYIAGEQRCRALCEGSFDQGWLPDFLTSVANHFTYCLKCKRKCSEKLKMFDGMKGKEILADIYNYLQFAYYKQGKSAKSYKCVASFLLIFPSDEQMIQNKKIYSSDADPENFTPRPEVVHYLTLENSEKKLLQFIQQSFTAEFEMQKEKDSTRRAAENIKLNEVKK